MRVAAWHSRTGSEGTQERPSPAKVRIYDVAGASHALGKRPSAIFLSGYWIGILCPRRCLAGASQPSHAVASLWGTGLSLAFNGHTYFGDHLVEASRAFADSTVDTTDMTAAEVGGNGARTFSAFKWY
jgi:hypothetical protein